MASKSVFSLDNGFQIAGRKEEVKVLKNGNVYLEDRRLYFSLSKLDAILQEEYHSPGKGRLYLIRSYPIYMMEGHPGHFFVDKEPFDGHDFRRLLRR
jgi:hypothetical protein